MSLSLASAVLNIFIPWHSFLIRRERDRISDAVEHRIGDDNLGSSKVVLNWDSHAWRFEWVFKLNCSLNASKTFFRRTIKALTNCHFGSEYVAWLSGSVISSTVELMLGSWSRWSKKFFEVSIFTILITPVGEWRIFFFSIRVTLSGADREVLRQQELKFEAEIERHRRYPVTSVTLQPDDRTNGIFRFSASSFTRLVHDRNISCRSRSHLLWKVVVTIISRN